MTSMALPTGRNRERTGLGLKGWTSAALLSDGDE